MPLRPHATHAHRPGVVWRWRGQPYQALLSIALTDGLVACRHPSHVAVGHVEEKAPVTVIFGIKVYFLRSNALTHALVPPNCSRFFGGDVMDVPGFA